MNRKGIRAVSLAAFLLLLGAAYPYPAAAITATETNPKTVNATVFWAGEGATSDNGFISNVPSAWDELWATHYGGEDDPENRCGYRPCAFTPKENPFYVALPYNDIGNSGFQKSNASQIPWYQSSASKSVSQLKNHWVAVTSNGATCYGQWEDVGPYGEDDIAYVFGSAGPRQSIGIDLSPAMRDCLNGGDQMLVSWRFVDAGNVPSGPWREIVTGGGGTGTSGGTTGATGGAAQAQVGNYALAITGISGNTLSVRFEAPTDRSSRDWVGLYPVGAADSSYLLWQYLPSGNSGTLSFNTDSLEPGAYEARTFENNGYTRRATSATYTIGSAAAAAGYALTISSEAARVGDSVTVHWQTPGGSANAQDWIALYEKGAPNRSYGTWKYTGDASSGDMTFTLDRTGEYEIRYLKNNKYTAVAATPSITVQAKAVAPKADLSAAAGYSLSATKSGNTIVASWVGPSAAFTTTDWIGLYATGAGNRSYLAWSYATGPSGTYTFQNVTPGSYEIRYFKSNGYDQAGNAVQISM